MYSSSFNSYTFDVCAHADMSLNLLVQVITSSLSISVPDNYNLNIRVRQVMLSWLLWATSN